MYKISLKENQLAEVEFKNEEVFLNGSVIEWNISKLSKNRFHIIKDNKSYNAEVIGFNKEEKKVDIKINNQIYSTTVKDKMDQLLERMGISNMASTSISDVKAPMPGLILDISVQIGQEIKKGDQLMVLEAMKMENVIKSPGDGIITGIEVQIGQSVEKNQILIKF